MKGHARLGFVATLAVAVLCGCGGNSAANCPPNVPDLTLIGYSTGAAAQQFPLSPIPGPVYATDATYIYFSGPEVHINHGADIDIAEGTPILHGSDGSSVSAGPLSAIYVVEDDIAGLAGYSASVSGLQPGVTYSVQFASITGSEGCSYGSRTVGTFLTAAS